MLNFYLGSRIYSYIDARIKKAYPQATQVSVPETKPTVFAYGCSFHKIMDKRFDDEGMELIYPNALSRS